MLFRDTPATSFEQCGRTSLPAEGEVGRCIEAAIAAQRPFVAQLATPRPVPAHRRPALVGAEFDGRYQVRQYIGDERRGERSTMTPTRSGPKTTELSFIGELGGLRCELSDAPPDAEDPGWRRLDERHRFHAGRCLEWFDAAAWKRAPWDARFDPDLRLACER
jgi:hypothetical protein